MKKISAPGFINDLQNVLDITEGGLGSSNLEVIIDTLDAVPSNLVNKPNGVVSLVDGKVPSSVLSKAVRSGVSMTGPSSLIVNEVGEFTLTDYNSFMTYNLIPISGSVTRVADKIFYTAPSTAQPAGFSINGRIISISISQPMPNAPTITSPTNGATNQGPGLTINTSAFSMNMQSDTHFSTDWQLATDIDFTNVVISSINDTANKTSWNTPPLSVSTTYYIRVRYKGTTYGYGNYSPVISISTKSIFLASFEEAILSGNDKASNDRTGKAVSSDVDTTRVVVGSYLNNPSAVVDAGAAYVFLRTGTTWTQEAKLVPSDRTTNSQFGYCVNISSDGTRIIIGAPFTDNGSALDVGAVYVYSRSGTVWTEETKIIPADSADGDQFGRSVASSSNANRIAVGAWRTNDPSSDTGSVYIFLRTVTTWTQEAKLTSSDKGLGDFLGNAVSMTFTADRIAVGSHFSDQGGLSNSGAVYIFSRSGTTWTEEAKLVASDMAINDQFGWWVALASNGTRCVVGALLADLPDKVDAGAAYVFLRSGTTWTEEAKLVASDGAAGDQFGYAVSINQGGSQITIGAIQSTQGGLAASGAAYIFTRGGVTWSEQTKLVPTNKAASDNFGISCDMAADGSRIIVGSYLADPGGTNNAGSAYIFS